MKNVQLEVCVDSLASARAAKKGKADRLELCGELMVGGVTPSESLFLQVREEFTGEIRCMIRPRFGDFLYSDSEFDLMKRQIKAYKALGADGVVFGVLTPEGALDQKRMEALISLAGSMKVTLHRAFDMTTDPLRSLAEAEKLGIATILTSGQENTAWNGRKRLKMLVEQAKTIEILVGSGVTPTLIQSLYESTKATSYHLSGRRKKESQMKYRNPHVSMGLASLSEYERWQTDADVILRAKKALGQLTNK